MDAAFAIDYERGLEPLRGQSYDAIVATLRAELPGAWLVRYQRMCAGATNVLIVEADGFTYLFDYSSELGALTSGREDRVVAAFGTSHGGLGRRPSSRIAGFPGSDARGDRGHLLAHAAGGGVDINLFHQDAHLNRGWSPQGKTYRAMERYCAAHRGAFCFSRPLYADDSARPSQLEFGVLRWDGTLWVEVFANGAP